MQIKKLMNSISSGFSSNSKKHLFYYTRCGILSLEKINLHLKGYKLKIYYYFYTRKGAYYGIK